MPAVREVLTPNLCADCRSKLTKHDKAKHAKKCRPCRDLDDDLRYFARCDSGFYQQVDDTDDD